MRAEQAAGSPLGVAAVTGSSGLVGAAVAATLHAAGFAVRGVDRAAGRWTSIVGDLRDPRVRQAALRRCAVLVHAAALHAPHVGHVDEAEFHAVNVAATEALLRDSEPAGVRRVVYISSTSVYGHALVPAVHLLHRAVGLTDVAAATAQVLQRDAVTGVFNIAGPYPFARADCPALHQDAAGVIAERLPEVAAAFRDRNWPLPHRLDRIYDSTAALAAFGYRPRYGIHQVLRADGNGRDPAQPE